MEITVGGTQYRVEEVATDSKKPAFLLHGPRKAVYAARVNTDAEGKPWVWVTDMGFIRTPPKFRGAVLGYADGALTVVRDDGR